VETPALIRFACVTVPSMDTGGITFPYLKAIEDTGLGVRIMPIGMARFDAPPWNQVPHLFTAALKERYINVVCVEPGVTLGAAVSTAQFGNPKAGDEEAYAPPTAISGLFTVGIPNIAILSGATLPEGKELEALGRYTAVVCPTTKESLDLDLALYQTLGPGATPTIIIPPDPDRLSSLFSGMTSA
jgi:hypothetical protein